MNIYKYHAKIFSYIFWNIPTSCIFAPDTLWLWWRLPILTSPLGKSGSWHVVLNDYYDNKSIDLVMKPLDVALRNDQFSTDY